jgi:hypothetical protein
MNRNRSSSIFQGLRAAAAAADAAGARRTIPIRPAGGLRRQNEGRRSAGPKRAGPRTLSGRPGGRRTPDPGQGLAGGLPPVDRSARSEGVSLCLL